MEYFFSDEPGLLAAAKVNEALARQKHQPTLLLLSGGSAFSFLNLLDVPALPKTLTIGMLDERHEAKGVGNNFAEFTRLNVYAQLQGNGVSFLDSRVKAGESFKEFGERFLQGLLTWRNAHNEGVVIATIGLGPDGHTAGLFPGLAALWDIERAWAVAYEVPTQVSIYTKRVSVTPTFLKTEVTLAIAYVVGAGKESALFRVMKRDGTSSALPAILWHDLKNLAVVTDIPPLPAVAD